MILKTVTFTGADDRTSISELNNISLTHPQVEWGILSSRHALSGASLPLLPGIGWVDRFLETRTTRCLHLCGELCRRFIAGDSEFILRFGAERLQRFQRLQLNFHDNDRTRLNTPALVSMLERYSLKDKEIIVPVGQENVEPAREMMNAGLNITVLFDDSRGAGIRPASWPTPLEGVSCGYAGGLGPDNIRAELGKISLVTPEKYETWIDMEGRIRTPVPENELDLAKIERCLGEAAVWLGSSR